MIYILDTVALVTALTVLHMTPKLWILSGFLLAGLLDHFARLEHLALLFHGLAYLPMLALFGTNFLGHA